ncbi:MAG: hypothetical protein RL141_652 [Candidatus Parcubacteria bacterium]|jgi:hypothetical protein
MLPISSGMPLKKAIHLLKNRFVLFGIFLAIFCVSYYFFSGSFLPTTETKDIWFYSGIFMVLFSILFIEPYYSSPKNVITNAIPLLLVFLAIQASFNNPVFWWAAVITLLLLIVGSIIALALEDKNKSPDHFKNKISALLKNFVVIAGQGKVLYSSVFIYFLLTYNSIQNFYTLVLFIFWFFVLSINPKTIHNSFGLRTKKESGDEIGEIFGVQSKKIFLVKLFEDRRHIVKFDVVKFRYSMQDANDLIITGIVFDTYLLNQEKWAKVLQLSDAKKEETKLEKNVVYKITDAPEIKTTSNSLGVERLVGIAIEGSTIGKIKFEYSKKNDDLQEGDLLELKVSDRRLFYQVIGGSTQKEKLEARNETGFIEGEAVQLGEWQSSKLSFQKFGWVPAINTPIFKADTSDLVVNNFEYPEYRLGTIPDTTLPSVINLSEAISHHTALLGITGSGKSFLTQKIIEEILQDTKVICIDFTGEWKKKIDSSRHQIISKTDIEAYLTNADKKIGIFELPALSNTTDVLKETQSFLELMFNFAKKKYDENSPVKIALVLEEAHTITPETSFLGDMGDYGGNKALINKMTQIALQGRKYGVGLLVIAQRTANVSKTVLTQCNTVVCFQAFDETSFTFLGNYVGKDMVQALPNLKQYHAVVAGKAIRSNMPMIIDLRRS